MVISLAVQFLISQSIKCQFSHITNDKSKYDRDRLPTCFYLHVLIGHPGKQCHADVSLNLNDSNQENCPKLQDSGLRRYLIHCTPFITGYSYPKCSSYCHLFVSCFDVAETPRWIKRYSKKFHTLSQQFLIAKSGDIIKINIKPRRPFWKGLFIITIESAVLVRRIMVRIRSSFKNS